ncbi:MAG: FecR domain-containing protein [Gemmataceae bacterium]
MADVGERGGLDRLLARLVDGTATTDDVVALEAILRTDPDARRHYVHYLDLHLELLERGETGALAAPMTPAPAARRPLSWFRLGAAVVVAASFLVVGWLGFRTPPMSSGPVLARFGPLHGCRWVVAGVEFRPGDPIKSSDRIELASGVAHVEFASGAVVRLAGPAIFEATSTNGGFLTVGQVKVVAATAESKGFTVQTRTARIVDVGTEFVATVSSDGHSHVDVTRGEVDVQLAGVVAPHRLRAGEALTVEPGEPQVVVRIESGDGSPRFRFPTIEPPSDRDYADRAMGNATIRRVAGTLSQQSGPVERLLDGRGQSKADSPGESVFFHDDQHGQLLIDMGRAVPIQKINAYSWHEHGGLRWDRVRATQKSYLYGSAGDAVPATDGPLTANGWVLIARVNTDDYFNVSEPESRPAQQATSVTATRGVIGTYRYLLWDVRPTQGHKVNARAHTFYGEIDVHAAP